MVEYDNTLLPGCGEAVFLSRARLSSKAVSLHGKSGRFSAVTSKQPSWFSIGASCFFFVFFSFLFVHKIFQCQFLGFFFSSSSLAQIVHIAEFCCIPATEVCLLYARLVSCCF